jgi:peptide/nickel transport system permease protein
MSTEHTELSEKATPTPPSVGAEPEEKLSVASQWQLIRWKFVRHKLAVGSLVVLGVLYVGVVFAEFISPYNPQDFDQDYMHCPPMPIRFVDHEGRFHIRPFVYPMIQSIDMETLRTTYVPDTDNMQFIQFFHRGDPYEMWGLFDGRLRLFGIEEEKFFLFGSDKRGRDVFSRIIFGSRVSLTIGLVGIAISFVLGIVVGGISGYYGGTVDLVIQRIIEFIRSVPTFPLWMALSAALPPDWPIVKVYFAIVVILSLVGWTRLARVVRGKFMSVREEDFVLVARLHGAGERRILFKHLLPSFLSHIIASLTLAMPSMILGETALSFIGLGMQAPAISWGVLLNESQAVRVLAQAPWLLIPGAFVVVAILAFNFVGDGLRDAADPYATL